MQVVISRSCRQPQSPRAWALPRSGFDRDITPTCAEVFHPVVLYGTAHPDRCKQGTSSFYNGANLMCTERHPVYETCMDYKANLLRPAMHLLTKLASATYDMSFLLRTRSDFKCTPVPPMMTTRSIAGRCT